MKKFYITTPIYYPSGRLHLGHAYTTIAGDVLKKYKQQQGYDVYYLTGTDEHGEKISKKAEEQGKTPQQFVDDFADDIKKLWSLLNIDYDQFIRTTDTKHKEQVQKIFDVLLEKGHIYLGEYSGQYCVSCESYFTDVQLVDGKCPDCGGDVKLLTEESYFFKTSTFVDRLLEHYEQNEDFILPKSRKNELINSFIKPGLPDLAISRSNFTWGIPIPNDEGKVIYVWLDALTNYITALDYIEDGEDFKKFWPADVQLMGKEIIRFHAIYWPMFLMALELPLPKKIFAHGWLLMLNDKMSKSKGNVIYSEYLVENYGVDTLRYYLLREIPFGDDGVFTPENYIKRINNDIINDLGNLVNRTIAMVNKYFDGTVTYDEIKYNQLLSEYHVDFDDILSRYDSNMENLYFSKALETIWEYISATNKFIDLTKPWELAKDDSNSDMLNSVLYALLDSIKRISIMIKPILNEMPDEISRQIGYKNDYSFAEINNRQPEFKVTEKPVVIMARLDEEVEVKKIYDEMNSHIKVEEVQSITFDEFKQTDLIVAEVTNVKQHPNADKLLIFSLNIGQETKQVVSGLAQYYKPEQLIGKKIMLVNNLEVVKIRGVESQGMILTTESENRIDVVELNKDAVIGSKVS